MTKRKDNHQTSVGLLDGGRKAGGEQNKQSGWGKGAERLESLPPDAASLRSSEPSSYVYRALRRGRSGSEPSGPRRPIWGGEGTREGE